MCGATRTSPSLCPSLSLSPSPNSSCLHTSPQSLVEVNMKMDLCCWAEFNAKITQEKNDNSRVMGWVEGGEPKKNKREQAFRISGKLEAGILFLRHRGAHSAFSPVADTAFLVLSSVHHPEELEVCRHSLKPKCPGWQGQSIPRWKRKNILNMAKPKLGRKHHLQLLVLMRIQGPRVTGRPRWSPQGHTYLPYMHTLHYVKHVLRINVQVSSVYINQQPTEKSASVYSPFPMYLHSYSITIYSNNNPT